MSIAATARTIGAIGNAVLKSVTHPVGLGVLAAAGTVGVAESYDRSPSYTRSDGQKLGSMAAAVPAALSGLITLNDAFDRHRVPGAALRSGRLTGALAGVSIGLFAASMLSRPSSG